jgi:hypothetical protein
MIQSQESQHFPSWESNHAFYNDHLPSLQMHAHNQTCIIPVIITPVFLLSLLSESILTCSQRRSNWAVNTINDTPTSDLCPPSSSRKPTMFYCPQSNSRLVLLLSSLKKTFEPATHMTTAGLIGQFLCSCLRSNFCKHVQSAVSNGLPSLSTSHATLGHSQPISEF